MTEYTVQSGDTLVRIAKQFGFPDWRTIYHAPENAAFRHKRPDPDRIFPGDELIIPDRDPAPGGFVVVTVSDEVALTLELTWRADWDRTEGAATMASTRRMVLTAPDLPAGSPVTFTVTQTGTGTIGEVQAASDADRAEAAWDDWLAPGRVGAPVQLAAGQPFPVVEFRFVAEAAGGACLPRRRSPMPIGSTRGSTRRT